MIVFITVMMIMIIKVMMIMIFIIISIKITLILAKDNKCNVFHDMYYASVMDLNLNSPKHTLQRIIF